MTSYDFQDVGAFHQKFGLDNTTYKQAGPREPLAADLLEFRVKFLFEELQETLEGLGYEIRVPLYELFRNSSGGRNRHISHPQTFDGLIDLVYVAYGLAHLMGYPWQSGWRAVQNKNMLKERATSETASERGGTWDVVKPEGWTPPDIAGVLRAYHFDVDG